jgi:glycosidase
VGVTVMDWHRDAAAETAGRLGPRLSAVFAREPTRHVAFVARFLEHGPRLIAAMHDLYGWTYDFYHHLESLVLAAAGAAATRPEPLVRLDEHREGAPAWFADHRAVGAVAYVDLFAGTLDGVRAEIDYLRELGVTYLHLMPLFAVPDGENDGGYAVSDYRQVNPRLGSMDDLEALAAELRAAGISLVVDFILNHTSDEHPWALAAKAGDRKAQALYWMFDDRRIPDRIQPHLRAIFPDRGGDSFTFRTDVPGPNGGKWVWTTFYTFQWDLNYSNPAVVTAMAGEMLFLANRGIEVLRLDAVPFLWKEAGTSCENRPEAHTVVEILNAVAALAAPALVFKSEAIVHPDDVVRFVSPQECRLSYNPLAMALSWEAIATGEVRMLKDALAHRSALPPGTAWVTYLRCHDDIGWGFADEDALRLGIDPAAHRAFLNAFYTGRFPGSFASGLPFQENPATGDCRICGTLAALAGLETAVLAADAAAIDRAVARILMLNGLIMTMGGLPLIYLGDEVAQLNDHGYRDDPAHAADARWVHRPVFPRGRLAAARAGGSDPAARIFAGMRALIALRKATPALAAGAPVVIETGHPAALAFRRGDGPDAVVVVASVSASPVRIDGSVPAAIPGSGSPRCLLAGPVLVRHDGMELGPCAFHVLARDRPGETAAPFPSIQSAL